MPDPNEMAKAARIIAAARAEAARHAANVLDEPAPGRGFVEDEVAAYVRAKFHLDEADCEGRSFDELAELSLSKSMKVSPELVREFDLARSCDGVSSAVAKKSLLFVAIQKDFHVKLDPLECAYAEDLPAIGALVWKALEANKA